MAAKILIIEDEAVIRRELKILLENAMYEAAVLTEFHHILPQIAEQSPDLIEYLWENKIFIDDNTLSVHMSRIREKLKAIGVHEVKAPITGISLLC